MPPAITRTGLPQAACRLLAALVLLALWAVLTAGTVRAQSPGAVPAVQDVQPVPPLSGRVIDRTGTLSAEQAAAIDAKLAAFEAEAGPQIVVLLVPTTAPEDIAAYAQRVADQWKIGRRDVGDGLVLLVAKNDRRVRVEVAKALEGAVPDLAARQIIDRVITPAFRNGDFAGGINAGLDQLIARIRGENLPAPAGGAGPRPAADDGFDIGGLMIFFFVFVPIIGGIAKAVLGRKLGSLATAGGAGFLASMFGAGMLLSIIAGVVALVLVAAMGVGGGRHHRRGGIMPPIIWGGGGFGGGGGGFGGGGFSSGGGGDFGGGGASGSW